MTDILTVLVMRLLGLWNTLKPFEISMHRANNQRAWERYIKSHGRGFIEDQEELTGFLYGKKSYDGITKRTVGENRVAKDGSISGAANMCQVIAVYNTIMHLSPGRVKPLYELAEAFENSGLVLNGCMGTSPAAAKKHLKELGYQVRLLYAGDLTPDRYKELFDEYRAFIFACFNCARGVRSGVHVMCATRHDENGQRVCRVHNGSAGDEREYNSLYEAVRGYRRGDGRPVFIMAIK